MRPAQSQRHQVGFDTPQIFAASTALKRSVVSSDISISLPKENKRPEPCARANEASFKKEGQSEDLSEAEPVEPVRDGLAKVLRIDRVEKQAEFVEDKPLVPGAELALARQVGGQLLPGVEPN